MCKHVTEEESIRLAQQLRIVFQAHFILFNCKLNSLKTLIFLGTVGGVEATAMVWCQSSSTSCSGILQRQSCLHGDLPGLLDCWDLIHNFSWGGHSTKYIVFSSTYHCLSVFTGCIWHQAQRTQASVSAVSTVVQKHHSKNKQPKSRTIKLF